MKELQTFKTRFRHYEDGAVYALTEHQLDNDGADLDSVSDYRDGAYREFDVEVTSRPPEETSVEASVTVPDVEPASVQAVPA